MRCCGRIPRWGRITRRSEGCSSFSPCGRRWPLRQQRSDEGYGVSHPPVQLGATAAGLLRNSPHPPCFTGHLLPSHIGCSQYVPKVPRSGKPDLREGEGSARNTHGPHPEERPMGASRRTRDLGACSLPSPSRPGASLRACLPARGRQGQFLQLISCPRNSVNPLNCRPALTNLREPP
jgi:hypothetical protein